MSLPVNCGDAHAAEAHATGRQLPDVRLPGRAALYALVALRLDPVLPMPRLRDRHTLVAWPNNPFTPV